MQGERPRRLGERTVDYGLAAMAFCEALPRGAAGRHVGDQLLRSATSVAANYAEASEAESPADFVHKLKLAQKELKESRVWLVFAARLAPGPEVEALREESRELLLMIGKSIGTAVARIQGKDIGA
jgi:four helix bundle protein